jgi:L-Ala-D/L-Glu epimerase
MTVSPVSMEIYHAAIGMRSFEHAAAKRDLAEAVLVRLKFSDGSEGWGETLPRPYVSGESVESVTADLENILWPAVAGRPIASDHAPDLPLADAAGRTITAAACAVDLAMAHLWLGGQPLAATIAARVSGVLGSADPARTLKRLRLMRLFGIRDFKLKLGMGPDVDRRNLQLVHQRMARGLAAGRLTLRVDINGGWDEASTPDRVAELAALGVCVVEQPIFCPAGRLVELARRCKLPLMADESLVTPADAEALLAEPRIWWNIRLSKNGGLGQCLRLAQQARQGGVKFVAGCMVGESGVLSAAQRRWLQMIPPPEFVEGNYGRFLLKDDLTSPSLRFGYGGRLKALAGPGLGVRIIAAKLGAYCRPVRTVDV